MNLAAINNKMDRYCGGLECGLHYFSESSPTICVASARARGLHSVPRFQAHNHRSAVRSVKLLSQYNFWVKVVWW